MTSLSVALFLPRLRAVEDLTVAMSGTRERTTFPSDMRASLPAHGGASAPGARSLQSAQRLACGSLCQAMGWEALETS